MVARCQARLLEPRNRFNGIGHIACCTTKTAEDAFTFTFHATETEIAECDLVREPVNDKAKLENPTPSRFKTSELLQGRIDALIYEVECPASSAQRPPDDDLSEAQQSSDFKRIALQLRAKISGAFFQEINEVQETALWHAGLNTDCIRVNNKGHLTQVTGWSRSALVPLWQCYRFPNFLLGNPKRRIRPARPDYADIQEGDSVCCAHPQQREFSFGEKKLFHCDHLHRNLNPLRRIYVDTMETFHPGFKQRMSQYQPFIDMEYAVEVLAKDSKEVDDWLGAMDRGQPYSLMQKLNGLEAYH